MPLFKFSTVQRLFFQWQKPLKQSSHRTSPSTIPYTAMLFISMFGLSFASIPLYERFCKATGYGGAIRTDKTYNLTKQQMEKGSKRIIEIDFQGTSHMPWEFQPSQKTLLLAPGETALAFYKAKNKTKRPIIGMSVYHVIPPEVGPYFNKIQCFCFEEQLLNPEEEVDMPVFFYVDPDIVDDHRLDHVDRITLSYVFFESDSQIPADYQKLLEFAQSSHPPSLEDLKKAGVSLVSSLETVEHENLQKV